MTEASLPSLAPPQPGYLGTTHVHLQVHPQLYETVTVKIRCEEGAGRGTAMTSAVPDIHESADTPAPVPHTRARNTSGPLIGKRLPNRPVCVKLATTI
jgi:hypothetical protein